MLLAFCHICLGLNVVGIKQVIINGHLEPRPLPGDTLALLGKTARSCGLCFEHWDMFCVLPANQVIFVLFQVSTLLQALTHLWAIIHQDPTHQGPTQALGATQPQYWFHQGQPPR